MAHSAEMGSIVSPTGIDTDQLVGLALVAGLPALFWTGCAALAFAATGITMTVGGAVTIATVIAGFLGFIFRALRNNSDA